MIRPKIRFATNADSPRIQELMKQNKMWVGGLDWSDIEPYWIVGEYAGEIVGAVSVAIGKPLGFIWLLMVDPKVHHQGVGIPLWRGAEKILAAKGCDGYLGFSDNEQVIRKLDHIKAVDLGDFTLFAKRVYRAKESLNGRQNDNEIDSKHTSSDG